VSAALGVWIAWSDVPHIRGAEVNVIFTIQKVLSGGPLYTDPADFPFDIAQYTPLYYLLAATILRCLGVAPFDAESVTTVCRLLSSCLTCLLLILAYRLLTRKLGVRSTISIMACAFILITTAPWYFLARPDSCMSLCMLTSWYFLLKTDRKNKEYSFVFLSASITFGILATFAKQNGLQALAVILVFFLIKRDWRNMRISLCVLTLLFIPVVVLVKYFFGPAMLENIIGGADNGISIYNAIHKPYKIIFGNFSLLIALTCMTACSWLRQKVLFQEVLLGTTLVFLFAFATVTALKVGSAENYYNEFIVMASIGVAYLFASREKLRRDSASDPYRLEKIMALYLLIFLPFWTGGQIYDYWYRFSKPAWLKPQKRYSFSAYANIVDFVRKEAEQHGQIKILSFESAINNLLPAYAVVPQKEIAALSYQRRVIDYSRFRNYVRAGRIKFLIIKKDEQMAGFLGANFDQFRHIHDIDAYAIYEYRE